MFIKGTEIPLIIHTKMNGGSTPSFKCTNIQTHFNLATNEF